MTKICTYCKKTKPTSEFYKNGKGFHSGCKDCLSIYYGERQRRIKRMCIEYKGGKCSVCGYSKNAGALEFHHTEPNKKEFIISKKLTTIENLKPELDKCILVCRNCHAEIHYPELEQIPPG